MKNHNDSEVSIGTTKDYKDGEKLKGKKKYNYNHNEE